MLRFTAHILCHINHHSKPIMATPITLYNLERIYHSLNNEETAWGLSVAQKVLRAMFDCDNTTFFQLMNKLTRNEQATVANSLNPFPTILHNMTMIQVAEALEPFSMHYKVDCKEIRDFIKQLKYIK